MTGVCVNLCVRMRSDKQSACNELQPVTSHLPHVDTLVCAYVYGCRTRAGVPAAVPSCGVCIWLQACACCRLRVLPPHHMPDARASPGRFAKTRRRSCRMLSTAMSASAPKRRSKTSTTRARARATRVCGRKPGRWFTVAIVPYRRRRSARRCCQVRMWARVRLHSSPVVQAQRHSNMVLTRESTNAPMLVAAFSVVTVGARLGLDGTRAWRQAHACDMPAFTRALVQMQRPTGL